MIKHANFHVALLRSLFVMMVMVMMMMLVSPFDVCQPIFRQNALQAV
jgi:hypothetical protein